MTKPTLKAAGVSDMGMEWISKFLGGDKKRAEAPSSAPLRSLQSDLSGGLEAVDAGDRKILLKARHVNLSSRSTFEDLLRGQRGGYRMRHVTSQ